MERLVFELKIALFQLSSLNFIALYLLIVSLLCKMQSHAIWARIVSHLNAIVGFFGYVDITKILHRNAIQCQ